MPAPARLFDLTAHPGFTAHHRPQTQLPPIASRAAAGAPAAPPTPRWPDVAALAGRLVELSGRECASRIRAAATIVAAAHDAGLSCAWIDTTAARVAAMARHVPGFANADVSLVRSLDATAATRTADHLLVHGGYGLVVVSLGRAAIVTHPVQRRLAHVCQQHGATLLFLTDKDARDPSLGARVAVRMDVRPSDADRGSSHATFALRTLRDDCATTAGDGHAMA